MNFKTDLSELIKNAIAGHGASQEQLILETQKPLYTFCLHLTKNKQIAEDLVNDTYLKALTSLKDLKDASLFLPWLKKIARNLHLDFVKSAPQKNQVLVEDYEFLDLTQGQEISTSQIDTFKLLSSMDEDDRMILVLVDIQDYSYSETAQILEIAEGTVKSRLSRARDKFADLYLQKKDGTKNSSRSS
ncbi:MAG: RNA polymerase sigma factor [Pseudobdellovibrio sp.]